ncbi:hypothetical protein SAMN02745751_02012 [Dethiosulfatibacter aminovorans DSM 17477]|uniref:AEC family transporter n=1 Tax=Dethiosulfatibacter aminovorans DSM 17477 TaxID=1121476 RepID=A0A1M6HGI8_9FIRM|nr:AEC family transporter [Dethiosulfatibacter aminovorans]SHJ21340.1 hypothetical protein SAMN02745751_02012 [Dethiosulfatibacter aminovorans DSM 17477]
MEYFILSTNVLFPVLVMIVIGYILKKTGLADEDFVSKSSTLVFKVALPAAMFYNTVNSKTEFNFDMDTWEFLIVTCGCLLATFFAAFYIAKKSKWDSKTKGAFVQGAYRSNYVIIGYVIIENLFGDIAMLKMSLLAVFVIPLYNILAVVILTIYNPNNKEINIGGIIGNIARNPLIIGIMTGFIFKTMNIPIPVFANNTLSLLKGIATPLALINIGSMFSVNIDIGYRKPMLTAVAIKTILKPLLFTALAVALGFRDHTLGVMFIVFATPTAASSFIMAKAMNSNETLASNIVVISTTISFITIFTGISVLKYLGLF